MKPDAYSQGDAFQAEKRTLFSTEWLPLCAEGQIARSGDFLSATVGGWGVVAVRDKQGTVGVLRNACRHQNMQVVGTPSGNCETFRCRFHGWTYDLQGRFVSAPPPVAPKEVGPEHNLPSLATTKASGLIFFTLAAPGTLPALEAPTAAYGGTLATDIACNWKVCVEHLLAEHAPSPDFTWTWPLLTVRRAGALSIVEQVVPHTFLRTRLFTHVFGGPADAHQQAAATIKHVCEHLQADRAAGTPAEEAGMVAAFHSRLAEAYARDVGTT
jgi:phenylpropionate dioxygenase-like ring-hydroxylating dioxygenase large terminal subunit